MIVINKKKNIFIKIFCLIFFYFFLTLLFFPSVNARVLECKDYKGEKLTQEEYRKIIEICNREIGVDRVLLRKKRTETVGVKEETRRLNTKIRISQAYINKKNAKSTRLKKDIRVNIEDIGKLDEEFKKMIRSLSSLLYQKNLLETNTALEAILIAETISDFYTDAQLIKIISNRIGEKIRIIKNEKESLKKLSVELKEREMLQRQLAAAKKIEQKSIKRNQRYKRELLGILQREEGVLEKNILSYQASKQSIMRRIHYVASGEPVTFGEAFNILNPHKDVLRMDPAFIMAILFQESGWGGRIGGNIGRCTYNQRNRSGNVRGGFTVMRNSQKENFRKIMRELGRDANTQKVSCPIPRDGAFGGAMGPAQFMPNTWMSVRDEVAKILGKTPSSTSPFINEDSFVASAVYLKRHYYSRDCNNYVRQYRHITRERTLRERCAASKYYSGSHWRRFLRSYGQSVVRRADRFRADIRVLLDQ